MNHVGGATTRDLKEWLLRRVRKKNATSLAEHLGGSACHGAI
jgi:hypothetical protein